MKQHRTLDAVMDVYKQKLGLQGNQVRIYGTLQVEIQQIFDRIERPLQSQDTSNLCMDLEYTQVSNKEAAFQIKSLNEQISLDVKKALHLLTSQQAVSECVNTLQQMRERVTRQESHIGQLERL